MHCYAVYIQERDVYFIFRAEAYLFSTFFCFLFFFLRYTFDTNEASNLYIIYFPSDVSIQPSRWMYVYIYIYFLTSTRSVPR